MAYVRQEFVDGTTVLSAEHLDKMQDTLEVAGKMYDDLYNVKVLTSENLVVDNFTGLTVSKTHVSSTFRGWRTTLGKPTNIHKISFACGCRNPEIPVTKIGVKISKIAENPTFSGNIYSPFEGDVLYEKTITLNEPLIKTSATTWITHELDTPILNNDSYLIIKYFVIDEGAMINVNMYEKTFDDIPYNPYYMYTVSDGNSWSFVSGSTAPDWTSKTVYVLPVKIYEYASTSESNEIIDTSVGGKFYNLVSQANQTTGLLSEVYSPIYKEPYGSCDTVSGRHYTENGLTGTFTGVCWDIGRIPKDFPIYGIRVPVRSRAYNGGTGLATKAFLTLYSISTHPTVSANPYFGNVNPVELYSVTANINIMPSDGLVPIDFWFDEPFYNAGENILAIGINLDCEFSKAFAAPVVYDHELINQIEGEGTLEEQVLSWYTIVKTPPTISQWSNRWVKESIAWSFLDKTTSYKVGNDIEKIIADEVGKLDLSNLNANSQRGEVRLAKQYDLVVGDKFYLYFSGCVKSFECLNTDTLGLRVKCEKGQTFNRYWMYTPVVGEEGEYDFTIMLRNFDGSVMSQATTKIVVHPLPTYDTATEYDMLFFGDSLTAAGKWCSEGIRRLVGTATTGYTGPASLKIPNLSLNSYGRKTNTNNTQAVRHEGYGGWVWASFCASSLPTSTTNGIIITLASAHGYNLDTVQKSIWTDNNGKVWELEDFPSDTQIKFNRGEGNNAAQNVTTLPTSMNCSALNLDITVASAEWESGNPFWDDDLGEINFQTHARECGASKYDIGAVLLTWNFGGAQGTNGMQYEANIQNQMNYATTVIRKFHTDFPDAKLIVMGIQLNSLNGGMGYNYGANGNLSDTWGTVFSAYDYNKALEELVTGEEFGTFCYYCDTKAQFDSLNMMPSYASKFSNRLDATEIRGSNGVHPTDAGYYTIGDAFFRTLVRVLNDINEGGNA